MTNQEQCYNIFGWTITSTRPLTAWCEVMAVTMNGVWKNLCLQCVHNFHGFEKVDKESKEVFSNLVIFSEKLELDLQEDDFIALLVVQHEVLINEDLMELEAQRKDKER